jgi:hypothetical protein
MSEKVSIAGLDKADVLRVLYDRAKPFGLGFLHYKPGNMSKEEAESLLAETTSFDYLRGRVMKISFGGNELETRLYDRDNGDGAAAAAIATLRT